MSHALIAVDGVLRKLVGGAPIPEGIRLYRSLRSTGQVILLINEDGHEQVLEWLELHGCIGHGFVARADWNDRVGQVNALRREGYDIDLVVVADPEQAKLLIDSGLNTLLFTHARYTQPSWRPDSPSGVQPWDDITKQVADLARMKAADERLRSDD